MMEVTPKNQIKHSRHMPTPKMSDRKKSLFSSNSKASIPATINEDIDLGPMSPLQFSSSPTSYDNSHSHDSRKDRFMETTAYRIDFGNITEQFSPKHQQSDILIQSSTAPTTSPQQSPAKSDQTTEIIFEQKKQTPMKNSHKIEKENSPMKTPHDPNTSYAEMRRKSSRKSLILNVEATPETNLTPTAKRYRKRIENDQDDVVKPLTNAKTSLQFNQPSVISAQSFYSSTFEKTEKIHLPHFIPLSNDIQAHKKQTKKLHKTRRSINNKIGNINKGVHHKIFKPKMIKPNPFKSMTKIELLEAANRLIENSSLNGYLNELQMKKQKSLTCSPPENSNAITREQISKLKRIMAERQHNFDTGRPLNWNISSANDPTSTLNNEHYNKSLTDEDELTVDEGENRQRKFFKSKRSPKIGSYKLTDRLSATVKRGSKLQLNSPKKKRSKLLDKTYDEFLSIQSEVSKIVQMLESDTNQANTNSFELSSITTTEETFDNQMTNDHENFTTNLLEEKNNPQSDRYERFCNKISYLTGDNLALREKHMNQLEFLISYGICTEENFNIFILEPEQHAAEIEQILNQLIVVQSPIETTVADETDIIDGTFADDTGNTQQIEHNDYPVSPTSQISDMTSGLVLDCAYQKDVTLSKKINFKDLQPKFYPIFHKNSMATMIAEPMDNVLFNASNNSNEIQRNITKWKPIGQNQLIIDAGQKEFGPIQCPTCDMFYTRHDPDDERTHAFYHSQRLDLQFKGWSDENVVLEVNEWGADGRILTITKNDTKSKRNRINDILDKVVHYELGCNGINWKSMTMVFLAIAKKQVIGICVVESVKQAYKAINENGIPSIRLDKQIPVKCGISRIWVNTQYRRMGIGTGLLRVVRARYIPGYIIQSDEIAFSSPTEAGLKFAEKLFNPVLVYDSI